MSLRSVFSRLSVSRPFTSRFLSSSSSSSTSTPINNTSSSSAGPLASLDVSAEPWYTHVQAITRRIVPQDAYTASAVSANEFLNPDVAFFQTSIVEDVADAQHMAHASASAPAPRTRSVDALGRAYATGRRKDAVARVWLKSGSGAIVVNGRPMLTYFPRAAHREHVLQPFVATEKLGAFDVFASVAGGGSTGQAGALRLGVARALQNYAPKMREELKGEGFLTRDPRVVERKKPGQAKARKRFQWVKR